MRSLRSLSMVLLTVGAGTGLAAAGSTTFDGYLDFKKPGYAIVDGQRVQVGPKTRLKAGKYRNVAEIPLGYRLKGKARRAKDGTLKASQLEAIANRSEFMESDVLSSTDKAEKAYLQAKKVSDVGPDGKEQVIGALHETGPDVDRCRRIIDRLLPPYVPPTKVRVYVVDNPEWNAMAMANFSIYVFRGLLKDMDDDELAIVLGHELAHATYEHSRRQARAGVFSGAAGAAAQLGAELLDNDMAKQAAQQATALGVTTFGNVYSRDYEDQADRVGLRYVYEAGYDYRKAPRLWNRFAEKYGDQDKVTNFFFGNHSLSVERAKALQKEINRNYADPAKDPPSRPAGR